MLSIDDLTRADRLRMMEVIGDDLARDSVSSSSPGWQAQALKSAERGVDENLAGFILGCGQEDAVRIRHKEI